MNSRRISIALIGPLPPPSGGMANQTRQLQALLGKERIAVHTIRVNSPYRPGWVGSIRGLRAIFRLVPYLASLWRVAGKVQLFHVMANSGKSWHLFAAPAVWIASLRKIPVVVNYRGGEAREFFGSSMPLIRPTLKRADRIIVPSSYLEQVFSKWGFASQIVPNIVDLSIFMAGSERSDKERVRREAPNILVARNLEPIYDIATAIEALSLVREQFPQATMTIAGSGPELGALQRLTKDLRLAEAVSFLGEIDNRQMPGLYQSADLVVNPSLADNMPISILEALASGVPVISTNVGGVPHLVQDDETALLVPPRDAKAMAGAITRVLKDNTLAARLRQSGLRDVRKYAWSSVRERLFRVYGNLLQKEIVGSSDMVGDAGGLIVDAGPLRPLSHGKQGNE